MIDGIRFKVCGLTSLVDAEFADRVGADYLGFILAPQSPRYLTLRHYRAMSSRLPTGRKRVAVLVEPSDDELAAAHDAGFSFLQIHFGAEVAPERLASWAAQVTPARLWLAPKLPPGSSFPAEWLPLAATFLIDTYQKSGHGGSGRTGDWPTFARWRTAHPQRTWILAGGLKPENVGAALRESGARVLDVNSGVEAAPGVKDHAKLRAWAVALHRARTSGLEAASRPETIEGVVESP